MAKRASKYTPGNYALQVRRSKTGKGLFTESPIPKGACIIEYTGRPVSRAEQYSDSGRYLFWTGKDTMINGNIPSNKARYINHSCDPNAETDIIRGKIWVIALRDIKKSEELFYNYGYGFDGEPAGEHRCLCRTSRCVGYILAEEHWPQLQKALSKIQN